MDLGEFILKSSKCQAEKIPVDLQEETFYQNVTKFAEKEPDDNESVVRILHSAGRKMASFKPTKSLHDVIVNKGPSRWANMLRVQNSGLLSHMNAASEEKQEILFSLLQSEGSYLNSLNLLMKHYVLSPDISKCLGKKRHHYIFRNIDELRKSSKRLMNMLCQMWRTDCKLDVSRIAFGIEQLALHQSSALVKYYSNSNHQMEVLLAERKSKKFATLLRKTAELSALGGYDLVSYLYLPIKRSEDVEKSMLRLRNITAGSGDPDRKPVQLCHESLLSILDKCRKSKTWGEGLVRTLALEDDFDFKTLERVPVIHHKGNIIKEGTLKCTDCHTPLSWSLKSKSMYVIAFDEAVFFTSKSRFSDKFEVIAYAHKDDIQLQLDISHSIIEITMLDTDMKLQFTFATKAELLEWASALQKTDACQCQLCKCEPCLSLDDSQVFVVFT